MLRHLLILLFLFLRNELPFYVWNVNNLPSYLLDELETYGNLRKEILMKLEKVKMMQHSILQKLDKFWEFKERCDLQIINYKIDFIFFATYKTLCI